jgi:L-lactate dehydrogenase (cytochrome)
MFDYVDGAAGNEIAKGLNESAIEEIRLQPRVLANVEGRSLATRILGRDMGLPFGIAPMGMCDLIWPGADRMLAAESQRRDMPHCMSTVASMSLEEGYALTGGRAWFQLYVAQSLESAMGLVDRAESTGYEVLILTVDVPQVSRRIRDLRNGFQVPFRMGPRQFFDFASHPRWSIETLLRGAPKTRNFETGPGGRGFARNESRGSTDWDFLARLRARWRGKLVVKGVLSPADALRIRDAGADAVYVSNHGGRQLDGAPAAIHALARVRAALGPDYPLIFDSGLRSGEDIVKALALGADYVMLGRPLLYAIGADGARGLSSLIDILAEEISMTLAQIGLRRIGEVDGRVLVEPLGPGADEGREAGAPGPLQRTVGIARG